MSAGAEISLRIGQRVRHQDYKGQRVTGIVHALSADSEQGLMASISLDEPIVIPVGNGCDEVRIWRQTAQAHEFSPFDERDELVAEMLVALQGVIRVADRATVEFDMARAAIAKATGGAA